MKNGLVIDERGNKYWYKDDLLHREDGPAVEWPNGNKTWRQNGLLHRVDGPAIAGSKCWYYKGIYVGCGDKPDPELWERVTSVEINGGPLLNGCVVDFLDRLYWYLNDQLHREDGPAIEYPSGSKCWYFNGKSLGYGATGFWGLWDRLTPEQRANPNLLKHLPR